jgi:hypothetical protein
MTYKAKRDGIINENEIGVYILWPTANKALKEIAKDNDDFEINPDGSIEFYGNVTEFESRYQWQGKVHDGNKVYKLGQRVSTDERVKHAQSITIDFLS